MDLKSYMTEEFLLALIEQYRAFGPFPAIILTFLKSFIPPLPTIVIVGANAAIYGFWFGSLYSWLGLISGCMVAVILIRKLAGHRIVEKLSRSEKVKKGLVWIQRNSFSYVFLLSIFPIGPFLVINVVAGLTRMPLLPYFIAISLGKGIMVFMVSFVGFDLGRFIEEPINILYVVALVLIVLWLGRKVNNYFTQKEEVV